MIKYLEHHFIDFRKYDECVNLHSEPLIYAQSWYLNTVCEKWDVLVLDDYNAVWPLPARRKLGLSYFYRPFAVQQLGIFSRKELPASVQLEFIEAMIQRCYYADVYLNEGQLIDNTPEIESLKISLESQTNQLVDISKTYQHIFENYSASLRRKVRKLEKANLQLFEHDGPEVLLRLFRENKGRELKLSTQFYQVFEKAMFQCLHRGVGKVLTVYESPNHLIAGAFFVKQGGRWTFLFSGLSDRGKEANAMAYLINEFIIFNCEKQVILDFEGSNHSGLSRFYNSFGASSTTYMRLVYNGLPKALAWLK